MSSDVQFTAPRHRHRRRTLGRKELSIETTDCEVLTEPIVVAEPIAVTAPIEVTGPTGVVIRNVAIRSGGSAAFVVGGALTILAALLLGFAVEVLALGALRHARDQRVAFSDLRLELAEGTAPVGQTTETGDLLPLGKPIATISIPAVGIDEVIFEGTTASVLRSGPGHRRDTAFPGQAGTSVVMGRQASYGGPFGKLDDLVSGDRLTVTTGQGRHSYVVKAVRRAGDPQPQPLDPGKGRLTLVTGTGPSFMPTDVLRVDADLVSDLVPSPPRTLGAASIGRAERAMAGDPDAGWQIVLSAQALLISSMGLAWARVRWGRWQTWVVGVPVVGLAGLVLAGHAARLLPNLL